MWRYIKDYPFSIIVVAIIIYLSLAQPPDIGRFLFKGADKVVHFCMYGGLSGVFWIEFLFKHRKKKANYLYALLGAVVYPVLFGGIMELCQAYFTRYRSGDWMDFQANTAGVITASLIAWFILRPLIIKKPPA
jgi:VanZ family protein